MAMRVLTIISTGGPTWHFAHTVTKINQRNEANYETEKDFRKCVSNSTSKGYLSYVYAEPVSDKGDEAHVCASPYA